MTYTQDQILTALHIIKTTCIESDGCESCPFANNEDYCRIMNEEPCGWQINSNEKWKALL